MPLPSIDPSIAAEQAKQNGNKLAAQRNYADALTQYNLAVELNPQLATGWCNKGLMHIQLKQLEQAINAFKTAIDIDKTYQKAHRQLLFCYEEFLKSTPHRSDIMLAFNRYKQEFLPTVIFGCVDLKLTENNEIKILECGDGMHSGFSGFGRAMKTDFRSVLKQAMGDVTKLKLLLTSVPGNEFYFPFGRDPVSANFPAASGEFQPTKLASYCGLYDGFVQKPTHVLDDRILCVGNSSIHYAFSDKTVTHEACMISGHEKARPQTREYPYRYTAKLAEEIHSNFADGERLVLKIPIVEEGKGVFVLNNSEVELDCALRYLLDATEDRSLHQKFCKMFAYTDEAARETRGTWGIVPASRLLVEKYIPSKPIKGLDGASYDATMRVAFIVVVEEGKVIACKPFAPYWKLAASSIGKGSLRDGTVSSFTTRAAQVRISSMPVSRADEKIVFTQLEAVLPGMMLHLSKLDFHQKFTDYSEKTISERAYKASQYVAIAEDFARRGSYLAAKFHLKCATELTDYKPALDIFIANIHLLSGEYEAGIQMLEKILKRAPADPQSHYLLGIIFKKQNKLEEAKQKFLEVTKMPNSYYARQAARELDDLALLATIDRDPELEKLFNSVDRDIYRLLDILDQQRASAGIAPLQPKFY